MSNKSPYNSPFRSKYLSPSTTVQQGPNYSLKKLLFFYKSWFPKQNENKALIREME